MMSMKGIIIDKDGTLFNYAYVWGDVVSKAIRGGFSELGLKGDKLNRITMRFEELFGIDERGGSYKNGILFRPDLAVITIAKMVLASLGAGLNPFRVKNKVFDKIEKMGSMIEQEIDAKEFPGIKELFKKLKDNGYLIGIVTNDCVATTRLFLKKMGAEEYVDFIRGEDSGTRKKPNPEAFRQFINEFSLKPEDVAVVGDSKADMKFASNSNAGYSIAVLTGSGDRKLLERMADKVYPTILDIAEDSVLFEKNT